MEAFQIRLNVRNERMTPNYQDCDTIVVEVRIDPVVGIEEVETLGINVKLVAQIAVESGDTDLIIADNDDCLSPGVRFHQISFVGVNLVHETYHGEGSEAGDLASLRYLVQVTVKTTTGGSLFKEREIIVVNPKPHPQVNLPIRMESLDEYMEVNFLLEKSQYCLRDTIYGQLNFSFTRFRESINGIRIQLFQRTVVYKEEGATFVVVSEKCVAGFVIEVEKPPRSTKYVYPIEIPLRGLHLLPTYERVYGIFSMTYHLRVGLVFGEDDEILGEHEVILYRPIKY